MLNKIASLSKVLSIIEWFQELVDEYKQFKAWRLEREEEQRKAKEDTIYIADIARSDFKHDTVGVFDDKNNRTEKSAPSDN